MNIILDDNDVAYIKLMLISQGSERGRAISEKLPNPHHTKMKKKLKPVIDEGKQDMLVSKKPYRTKPDYPKWKNKNER